VPEEAAGLQIATQARLVKNGRESLLISANWSYAKLHGSYAKCRIFATMQIA
jgi:hypothetical protein